jgi:GNAT superfamily N-acetyltransferase
MTCLEGLNTLSELRSIDIQQGYVNWRLGTAGDIELTNIRVDTKRRGYGRRLFYILLTNTIRWHPTAKNIYGFTETRNEGAQVFYESLGFHLYNIPILNCKLFCQEVSVLESFRVEYESTHRNI